MASKSPSNFALRLATAAVALPLILLLLYRGTPVAFYALVYPAALIATYELFAMTHPGDRISQAVGLALSGLASLVIYFGPHDGRVVLTLVLVLALLGPVFTLFRLGDIKTAALRAFTLGLGPLLIAVPLTLLASLRRDQGAEGAGYVLMTLMFAWFGDTGGYFAGRYLGKHPLYPAVSPKKTIEGAVGGLAGSIVGGLFAYFWYLPSIPVAHAVGLAILAGTLGQAGDLSESLIKRSMGVKDSGQIVPGHGGVLDRIDAVIMTSAVVYLYTVWCPLKTE